MYKTEWQLYLAEIPFSPNETFWVSFESDPGLKKTKANIYGRCLPCIEALHDQLQNGCQKIQLGNAYHCWKIAAVVADVDECLKLLSVFETRFPGGHVYGKFGSSRADSTTKAVVFHAEDTLERDRVQAALKICLFEINPQREVMISRACAVLYENLLGDWRDWQPVTPVKYPENIPKQLEAVKRILRTSRM